MGCTSVVAGPSGAGKSSLINALCLGRHRPDADLSVAIPLVGAAAAGQLLPAWEQAPGSYVQLGPGGVAEGEAGGVVSSQEEQDWGFWDSSGGRQSTPGCWGDCSATSQANSPAAALVGVHTPSFWGRAVHGPAVHPHSQAHDLPPPPYNSSTRNTLHPLRCRGGGLGCGGPAATPGARCCRRGRDRRAR